MGAFMSEFNPIAKAQELMRRAPLPKRFYKEASTFEGEGGFALMLDGRPAKTPGRAALRVPKRAVGEAIASEWQAVGEHIDPSKMPLTRLVNSIIDGVLPDPSPLATDMLRYATFDLVSYRAEQDELAARQQALWDPFLSYAEQEWGARFVVTGGIMAVTQTEETISAFAKALPHEPWTLGAMHVVMTLTGSAIMALSLAQRAFSAETVWLAAHVDEDFQIERWGTDDEAVVRRALRREEFDAAEKVLAAR